MLRAFGCAAGALVLCALALGSAAAGDFGRPDPSICNGILPKQHYVGPVAPLSFLPLNHSIR